MARWSGNDVILVFVNLRNQVIGPEVFSVPQALPLSGHSQAVTQVADDPGAPLRPQPQSADDLRNNGIQVQFNFPNEVQYIALKPM